MELEELLLELEDQAILVMLLQVSAQEVKVLVSEAPVLLEREDREPDRVQQVQELVDLVIREMEEVELETEGPVKELVEIVLLTKLELEQVPEVPALVKEDQALMVTEVLVLEQEELEAETEE